MKSFTKIALLITLAFAYVNINAQFTDFGFKGGIQFNGVMPATEFEDDNGLALTSYLARGFVRFELLTFLNAELGAGYGNLKGDDFNYVTNQKGTGEYSTSIIPIDFRILITPLNVDTWNPYIYAGIGIMNYSVGIKPSVVSPEVVGDADGWTPIIPLGVGAEIKMIEGLSLDLTAGLTYSLTDDLNYFKIGDYNDAFFTMGAGLTFSGESMNSDKDNDGLTKGEEKEIGTDPNNPDSDADGLKDGAEFKQYNTDPKNPDSDGEGLSDGDEVREYKSNPNKADTDSDDLNDYEELMNHGTDPLVADTDKDGLSDGDEVLKYKTDPMKSDSDNDGLTDSEEVNKYKTNPLLADTDNEGLHDGDEVLKYKTNPLMKDTDNGTIDDLTEVNRGTDPLNKEDDVVKVGVPIVLEGITFATNKADITPESENVLMGALKTLNTYSDIVVEISGYTDSDGSNSYNKKLSQRRSESVKSWLIAKGISAGRITAVGYGEDSPRVANDTPDNKRLNRRIEFKRIK